MFIRKKHYKNYLKTPAYPTKTKIHKTNFKK